MALPTDRQATVGGSGVVAKEEAWAPEGPGMRRWDVVGRDAELALVRGFVAAAEHIPQALVLDGEAGIGKTTLFEAALSEARRRGFDVFFCRPVGAEAAFSFAALADLVAPMLPRGTREVATAPASGAVRGSASRGGAGPPPEERATAVATQRLFEECARQPLLIAIDDVQWLDAPSAAVLAFVLRRLASRPVAILVARRSTGLETVPLGLERAFPDERLCRLRLGGLSVGATHRLLRARLGRLVPEAHAGSAARRLRRESVLLARVRACAGAVRGPLDAGGRVPFPESRDELVATRLAALPEVARPARSRRVAVRSDRRAGRGLHRPGRSAGPRLREAEAAGIVVVDGDRIRFSHPLLAARVHEQLEPHRRRSLHRRLAEFVTDPEERARHLALAAEGPSDEVAGELESAAAAAARRGALGAAAELAELSVALTPAADAAARRRRQLLAADHHFGSGDVGQARRILDPLLERLPPGSERAGVLLQAGWISDDNLEQAERLLEQAFAEAESDAPLRAEAVTARIGFVFLRHGPAAAVRLGRESARSWRQAVIQSCSLGS